MRVFFARIVPACATETEYDAWKDAARRYRTALGFCADCTPGYQAQMKIEGRCEHPEVWFDDDGGRVGEREDATA